MSVLFDRVVFYWSSVVVLGIAVWLLVRRKGPQPYFQLVGIGLLIVLGSLIVGFVLTGSIEESFRTMLFQDTPLNVEYGYSRIAAIGYIMVLGGAAAFIDAWIGRRRKGGY